VSRVTLLVLLIEGRPPVPRFCGSRCIVCLRCSPTPAGPLRCSPVLPAGARRYCVSTNPAWRPPVLFPAGARRYSVCRNPIVTAVCLGACSRVVSAYRRKARALSLSLSQYTVCTRQSGTSSRRPIRRTLIHITHQPGVRRANSLRKTLKIDLWGHPKTTSLPDHPPWWN